MLFAYIIHLTLNTFGLVFILLFCYNKRVKEVIAGPLWDKVIATFIGLLLGFDVVMSIYFIQQLIERGKV